MYRVMYVHPNELGAETHYLVDILRRGLLRKWNGACRKSGFGNDQEMFGQPLVLLSSDLYMTSGDK